MGGEREGTVAGYRDVVGHPTTRRLLGSSVVSIVGDFVGAGALLVLAFERAGGRAVGAAGFLAATGLGGLLVAIVGGPLLDRIPRRAGLVGTELVGAAAILVPLLIPTLWPTYVAAFVLGARRSVEVSIRHGVLADAVPDRLRSGLLGLLGTTDQSSQVLGYLMGASMAVTIGPRLALSLDLVTFLVAAVVLLGLDVPPRTGHVSAPSVTAGWRAIAAHPQLRLLALLVAASGAASALPETLAAVAVGSESPWLPIVLASGPAGGVLGFLVAGKLRSTTRFGGQMVHLTLYGAAVAVGAVVSGPVGFTLVNIGAGAGAAWIIGPQVAFVRLAPRDHISQIMAAMVALVMLAEGGWVLVGGAIADRAGINTAYLVAALVITASAVVGWGVHARRGASRHRWDPVPEPPPATERLQEMGVSPGVDRAG